MSSSMTSYSYKRLDDALKEIRLLVFTRSSTFHEDARISCSITTVLHAEAPSYYAISYAWGDSSEAETIILDGSEARVSAQAEAALRCMRAAKSIDWPNEHDRSLYFWIDALCIDQADTDERSQQVAIMSEIYSAAQEVLIYLGTPFAGCQDTTRLIKTAADRLKAECRSTVGLLEALEFNTEMPSASFPIELDTLHLQQYFSSPWFRRLWVLQEAMLGRAATAYYGSYGIALMDAVTVARWIAKLQLSSGAYRDSADSLVRSVDHCRKVWEMKCLDRCAQILDREGYCEKWRCYDGFTLAWLLQHTNGQEHSEPRDAVYAVLGLCFPAIAAQIVPDYRLPLSQVFSRATMVAIEEHMVFRPLRWARVLGNKPDSWYVEHQWPTWVPLWQERDNLNVNASGFPWWRFSAHGGTRADAYATGVSGKILVCTGYIVGRIGHVAPAFMPGTDSIQDSATYVQMILRTQLPRTKRLQQQFISPNAVAALGLTLAAGYYPFVDADAEMGETHFGAFLRMQGSSHLYRQLSEEAHRNVEEGVGDAQRYLVQVSVHSRFRSLFFTREGHMGLGPQHMRRDDLVCLAFGSRVPWILREHDGHFTFVGPCYVAGIMDGQFMRHAPQSGVLMFFKIH